MPTQQNSLVWLAYGRADLSLTKSLIDQKSLAKERLVKELSKEVYCNVWKGLSYET